MDNIVLESASGIGGFQFDVNGAMVLGASGGAAGDAEFMISNSETRVIGFSGTGFETGSQDFLGFVEDEGKYNNYITS